MSRFWRLTALYVALIGVTFLIAYAVSRDAERSWKIGAFSALGFIVVLYVAMLRERRK